MNWNLSFDGVCRVMLNNYLVRREIVVSFQKRVDPNRRFDRTKQSNGCVQFLGQVPLTDSALFMSASMMSAHDQNTHRMNFCLRFAKPQTLSWPAGQSSGINQP